jgi:glucosamine--fructose-6-phosphate aminotransferase (isomerizing)
LKKSKKQEGTKLGKAVQIALNQVVGAYAIAVLIKKIQMN